MPISITTGKISAPVRAVFYGPEGIGKSTFATWAPSPLFLDVEQGTKHLDVARIDGVNGWPHVSTIVKELAKDNQGFKTLVIDTIDWLEKLATEHLCSTHNKDGIEGFGYGKGYIYVRECFDRLLGDLDVLANSGMHILMLAHSHTRKHEDPGRAGAYDRHELKLSKHVAPIIKEWADLLCFMNYQTIVTEGDKGNVVAGGKERVLHCQHTAAFDAKNRHDLPETAPMKWKSVASAFEYTPAPKPEPKIKIEKPPVQKEEAKPEPKPEPEPEPTTPEVTDPLTQVSPPEPATQVQKDNCQKLWSQCSEKLDYGAEQMTKLWDFYELPQPAGSWGGLSKDQASEVIGFLTSKLEA